MWERFPLMLQKNVAWQPQNSISEHCDTSQCMWSSSDAIEINFHYKTCWHAYQWCYLNELETMPQLQSLWPNEKGQPIRSGLPGRLFAPPPPKKKKMNNLPKFHKGNFYLLLSPKKVPPPPLNIPDPPCQKSRKFQESTNMYVTWVRDLLNGSSL